MIRGVLTCLALVIFTDFVWLPLVAGVLVAVQMEIADLILGSRGEFVRLSIP